jgi:DNA-binding MarR family transcriptional regulator
MTTPSTLELNGLPGHDIRRLHQIAVALFMQEAGELGVTPVQYAALQAVQNTPGIDQRTLARAIGFDTSTIAGVIDRLEARGLMQRNASAQDRRVRLLTLTQAGQRMVADVVPAMLRAQARILAPLPPAERDAFMRMLGVLVAGNGSLDQSSNGSPT